MRCANWPFSRPHYCGLMVTQFLVRHSSRSDSSSGGEILAAEFSNTLPPLIWSGEMSPSDFRSTKPPKTAQQQSATECFLSTSEALISHLVWFKSSVCQQSVYERADGFSGIVGMRTDQWYHLKTLCFANKTPNQWIIKKEDYLFL